VTTDFLVANEVPNTVYESTTRMKFDALTSADIRSQTECSSLFEIEASATEIATINNSRFVSDLRCCGADHSQVQDSGYDARPLPLVGRVHFMVQ
jgi:hypothetical protein